MKEELLEKETHAIPEKCTRQEDLFGQFLITISSPHTFCEIPYIRFLGFSSKNDWGGGWVWSSLLSGDGMGSLFTRAFTRKWTLVILAELAWNTGRKVPTQKQSSSEKLTTSDLTTATKSSVIEIITNSPWLVKVVLLNKVNTSHVPWKSTGRFRPGCFVCCCQQKYLLEALCLVTGHCSYSWLWKLFRRHKANRRGMLCVWLLGFSFFVIYL